MHVGYDKSRYQNIRAVTSYYLCFHYYFQSNSVDFGFEIYFFIYECGGIYGYFYLKLTICQFKHITHNNCDNF